MKRVIITGIAILAFIIPGICFAQTCATPIDVPSFISDANKVLTIRNALADYTSYATGGQYELCFDMNEALLTQSELASTLAMTTNVGETLDVYIVGLKIRSDPAEPITSTILQVNNQGNAGVIVKDMEFYEAANGVQLLGNTGIKLTDSIIEGDAAKSGNCVHVQAAGTEIEGVNSEVEIKSCNNGVYVQGNTSKIKNARIWDNKIGVHIAAGVLGTDIEGSMIYANNDGLISTSPPTDGIRIADGAAHQIAFYDTINNIPEEVLDGLDDTIDYEDRTAYIFTPVSVGEVRPVRVELFTSDRVKCGLPPSIYTDYQPCGVVKDGSEIVKYDIDPATINEGPVNITIPSDYRHSNLVIVYTDPELGTAGISRQFSVTNDAGGGVAFVSNPYDIPTTGGASDAELASGGEEEIESEDDGGNSAGGGGLTGEGGGGGLIQAADGGGCKGSSLANNSFESIFFTVNVWWVLLFLVIVGAMRHSGALAKVKIKHRLPKK
jgi:hypothetical protein